MLPRSKWFRIALFVVPLVLAVLLWSIARGRPRFVQAPAGIIELALSPDGVKLAIVTATGSGSGEVWWRENSAFQPLATNHELDAQSGEQPKLQFSRDGQTLLGAQLAATQKNQSRATAWDLSNQNRVWSDGIPDYRGIDNGYKFSPDGRRLGLLHFDTLKVLDCSDLARSASVSLPTLMRVQLPYDKKDQGGRFSRRLALSHQGDVAAVADQNVRLQFWDVATGRIINETPPPPQYMRSIGDIAFSPDGRYVALGDSGTLALWDRTRSQWLQLQLAGVAPRYLAWMPDSRSLWLGSDISTASSPDNRTRRLSVPDLKTMRTLPVSGPLAISGDGRTLATRDDAQKGVLLWNIN